MSSDDGERIERMIAEWGERNFPRGPTWYGRREKDALPALEIRMIPAFSAIEYNISNGGWAQFLWNCFPDWRTIIADAKQGYLLIGAAEQGAALDNLYALCERDEKECAEMHRRANAAFQKKGSDAWSAIFGEFTSGDRSAAGQRDMVVTAQGVADLVRGKVGQTNRDFIACEIRSKLDGVGRIESKCLS